MSGRIWQRALVVATMASALLALAGPLTPATAAVACKPATDIEAIVDDSFSMDLSDPDRLRVQGLVLLIDTLPASTTLGAIEFGSASTVLGTPAASRIFSPNRIGQFVVGMKSALRGAIHADNGTTDYNGAFALADSENPGAQARIFLTDGGHNEGEYANGHLAHNVPTYVIGFGEGLSGVEDQGRLERIASETGGHYYPLADASQLQAVMNSIGAELACKTPPRTFTDQLAAGSTVTRAVPIAAGTRAAQIALTWASPRDRFELTELRLVTPGGKAPPGLKVLRRGSATFALVEVSGLGRGRLRFSVEATRVRSGAATAMLTTQVTLKRKGE